MFRFTGGLFGEGNGLICTLTVKLSGGDVVKLSVVLRLGLRVELGVVVNIGDNREFLSNVLSSGNLFHYLVKIRMVLQWH